MALTVKQGNAVSLRLILIALFLYSTGLFADVDEPEGEESKFRRAVEFFQNGAYDESRELFETLTRSHPGRALYWLNLGNVYVLTRRFDAAISSYGKVIELKSPLAPVARLNVARSYAQSGRAELAKGILRALKKSRLPPNLQAEINSEWVALNTGAETHFAMGVRYYRNRKYRQALTELTEAVRSRPDADAHMMRGLTLLQLRESEAAHRDFQNVLKMTSDTKLREDANYFVDEINRGDRKGSSPFWLFFDLSGGYNSNLYGNNAVDFPKSVFVIEAFLGTGYQFLKADPYSAKLKYTLLWDEFLGLSSGRFSSHSLQLPFALNSGPWMFELGPIVRYQYLGSVPFAFRPGARAAFARKFDSFEAGMMGDFEKLIPGSSGFSFINGSSWLAKTYLKHSGRDVALQLFLVYGEIGSGDLPLSTGTLPLGNRSVGPGLSLVWFPAKLWEIDGTLAYYFSHYFNVSLPQGLSRDDRNFTWEMKAFFSLSDDLRLFMQGSSSVNNSTLGGGSVLNKNYTRFVFQSGLSWNIFR